VDAATRTKRVMFRQRTVAALRSQLASFESLRTDGHWVPTEETIAAAVVDFAGASDE
jgi:hypothetical protein